MAVPRCSAPHCNERLVFGPDHPQAGKPKPAGTKTCSPACRAKRARAKKRSSVEAQKTKQAGPTAEVQAIVAGKLKDAAHDVMVDELRPIVREAMTADVLKGIDTMIKLQPEAIAVLQQQMQSQDETIAQRAVTLLLKYTMGNPSVAPPPTEQAAAPMSVVFNIPRPGDTTAPSSEDAVELRECTDCNEHKPDAEFVGASSRCQACFAGLHATLEQRFAKDDPTAP